MSKRYNSRGASYIKRGAAFAIVAVLIGFLAFWGYRILNFYRAVNGDIPPQLPAAEDYPVKGVDISYYQGEINWEELSAHDHVMFAYIKGSLEMKFKNYVVIDVGGLGYKIFMAENAINSIGEIGEIIKVFTYYRVREDDVSIFGFKTQEELRMFELLLSVSGVGAKSALAMLSCIEPSEFAIAVISNNIKLLTQIPGIGTKSAQRIILEKILKKLSNILQLKLYLLKI